MKRGAIPRGTVKGRPNMPKDFSSGGPKYSKDLPSTQPKSRSAGFPRVKTRPQEKGL